MALVHHANFRTSLPCVSRWFCQFLLERLAMWPRGHMSNRMRSASFGLRLLRQCERGPRLHFTPLDFARGRRRLHGAVHGRRHPRVRSRARISCVLRGTWRRHMRCRFLAMALAIEVALRGMSLAADPRFPDWPCNQIKVPEISVAAVWAGPPIDDVGNAWEEDATIKDLVARLAARRTPLDDAQKAIADAVTGTESERQKKAKLIFAGLFKTLNHERSEVMRGIERYARKQK